MQTDLCQACPVACHRLWSHHTDPCSNTQCLSFAAGSGQAQTHGMRRTSCKAQARLFASKRGGESNEPLSIILPSYMLLLVRCMDRPVIKAIHASDVAKTPISDELSPTEVNEQPNVVQEEHRVSLIPVACLRVPFLRQGLRFHLIKLRMLVKHGGTCQHCSAGEMLKS